MQNRISDLIEQQDRQDDEPQPIGRILEELLAKYERRFPGVRISVLETAATAV
jgi:hypothetical protein